jgi:hypothetical protein
VPGLAAVDQALQQRASLTGRAARAVTRLFAAILVSQSLNSLLFRPGDRGWVLVGDADAPRFPGSQTLQGPTTQGIVAHCLMPAVDEHACRGGIAQNTHHRATSRLTPRRLAEAISPRRREPLCREDRGHFAEQSAPRERCQKGAKDQQKSQQKSLLDFSIRVLLHHSTPLHAGRGPTPPATARPTPPVGLSGAVPPSGGL